MIELHSYQSIEDAWAAGIAAWCRGASANAFAGAKAWLIAASDGQAGWIRRRLLHQGVSLFGVQFLDPRGLRRELCGRLGIAAPILGAETLSFLLRLHLLRHADPAAKSLSLRPIAGLEALSDLAAAGWLDLFDPPADLLPEPLLDAATLARDAGFWLPHTDRALRAAVRRAPTNAAAPLTVCVVGWDAGRWPLFDLLVATLRAADTASAFIRLPREPAASVERDWLSALEAEFGGEIQVCPSVGFQSAQAPLAGRLEGADLDLRRPLPPELLVGKDWADAIALVRDFTARWLLQFAERHAFGGEPVRLAILCARRTPQAVATMRALAAVGIAFEDGLGELLEPSLDWQTQRALLRFHRDEARVEALLTLIELLGAHAPERFALNVLEVRQALQRAFADCQHDSVRVLAAADSFAREPVAEKLRALLGLLPDWPAELTFQEALEQWQRELTAFGLTTEPLDPRWTAAAALKVEGPVPLELFFTWLDDLLGRPAARRTPEGANRFARVCVTTLQNAAGQTWGGAVFLDSHEGAWPLYPGENPVLDDRARRRLNAQRDASACGHLLTSADRAHLEQAQLCELLENCDGPLAFSGPAHDPADAGKELYPNEWALRCLVESARGEPDEGPLLDRWRNAVQTAGPEPSTLRPRERSHLQRVHVLRRDPRTAFDEYGFNFEALHAADELPLADAWSTRDLDDVTERPATFALAQIFGAEPWRGPDASLLRKENWAVGRLVHRWVKAALHASRAPRRFGPADWEAAKNERLNRETERTRAGLAARVGDEQGALPLWWEGVVRKAQWASRRCLDALAEAAAASGQPEQWVVADQRFSAEAATAGGPLRLRAVCDAAILDRNGFAAAVCHLLDVKSGASPKGKAPLNLAALLVLARERGAAAETLKVGVIHPEGSNLSMLGRGAFDELGAQLGLIAAQQRSLIFGQRPPASDRGHERGEELPMATARIDPAILRAKAEKTEARLLASSKSYVAPI